MQRRACAKINLSLHITGRREDGYHLLDSIVAFAADAYDTLTVAPADTLSLTLEERTEGLPRKDNLILKAARSLNTDVGAALTLRKLLPMGGGIGGGSADAAAALHLLNDHWQLGLSPAQLHEIALPLGADVPVCVRGTAAQMQGIGEKLSDITLPSLYAVLVNPGVHVATRAIFAHGIPAGEPIPPQGDTTFLAWLKLQRNDLEPYAIALAPVIGEVLAALHHDPACQLARMSGSGSTCFGLFTRLDAAEHAVSTLQFHHPDWWVVSTALL